MICLNNAELDEFWPWAEVHPLTGGPWAADVRALVARLHPARAADACAALIDELPPSLRRAVPQRQYEFLVGRRLARKLLGVPCGRRGRAPVWPPGVTGSISHTRRLVVVAVGPIAPGRRALGLDVESVDGAAAVRTTLTHCFTRTEYSVLRTVADGELLGFSAKESVYKAVHAALGLSPDFLNAEVVAVDVQRRRLKMNFGMDDVHASLHVSYRRLEGHVLTACEFG